MQTQEITGHPPIKPGHSDERVLARLPERGLRRLNVGELRQPGDVYADSLSISPDTHGWKIHPGDFIFRYIPQPEAQ